MYGDRRIKRVEVVYYSGGNSSLMAFANVTLYDGDLELRHFLIYEKPEIEVELPSGIELSGKRVPWFPIHDERLLASIKNAIAREYQQQDRNK